MEAPHKFMAEDDHKESVPACPACGSRMRLVHVVPRLGAHPELRSFRCTACDEVVTSADD
jgi:DNA-directed RNA polymerase subunit RPC12/RpoP